MVILDHLVHRDREAMLEKMAHQAFQDHQDHRETMEIVVLQDLEVQEGSKVYREHPEIREHRVKMVKLVNRVQLVQPGKLESEVNVAFQEKEVQSVHQEPQVYEESTVLKAMMAHRVHLVQQV